VHSGSQRRVISTFFFELNAKVACVFVRVANELDSGAELVTSSPKIPARA
jgi:hypothetical protein